MSTQSKLAKINLYDKFNAAFVSLITDEMAEFNRVRKQNSYSSKPTFERPFDMPLEFISIDGVNIRMAKSRRKTKFQRNNRALVSFSTQYCCLFTYLGRTQI